MSIYDSLNPMQREAVLHTDGPLLILAGAGSGKTRVLTHRIAYLIDEKEVNPWNILAITFTNKAAEEMRERVDKLVGFGSESIWVATFHSTCVRILRRYIHLLGYDSNFTIYDADDSKALMKQVIKRLDLDPKLYKEKVVLGYVSNAKNERVTPDEMYVNAGMDFRMKQIANIYGEYQKSLKANNALDFDDLLMKTVELFLAHPEVLSAYQERFRYIMVDEYQDTNTVQFQFVKLLAKRYQNLCVVGDDDQSIYKFRGANIGNILSFEEYFPDAKVIKLEQNYRSTSAILNAANEVIANNRGRKSKRLWTARTEGSPVRFQVYDNGYEEAEGIVKEIRNLVEERTVGYQDCAVLYRTNAQSRVLEEKCIQYNVPYRLIGGVNFYQRQEIKDILAYLKTIDNGKDDLAVRRILNVPKRGIGTTTEEKIVAYAAEHELDFYTALTAADQIPGLSRAAAKIKKFVQEIETYRNQAEFMEPDELIRSILENTSYLDALDRDFEEEKAEQKKENIEELINKAVDFGKNYTESNYGADVLAVLEKEDGTVSESRFGTPEKTMLSAFLEEVALIADIDSMDDSDDRITLMTLHGAKGLEFPRVYMSGMEEGLFPSYMSICSDDPTDIEEERRLCYVGITRAMNHLTLSCAKLRTVRGETQANAISRFVKEIPDDMLEQKQRQTERRFFEWQPVKAEPASPFQNGFGGKSNMDTVFDREKKPASALPPTGIYGAKLGKAFTVEKQSSLDYKTGDRVTHMKFGDGVVTNITEGKRDFEVTVLFDTAGQKRMFASFAKLKKL